MNDNDWTILTLENMPAGFFAGGYEVDCGEGTVAVRYPHDPEGFMGYLLSYPGIYRYRKAQPKQPSHEEIMTKWWKFVDPESGHQHWDKVFTYDIGHKEYGLLFRMSKESRSLRCFVKKDWFAGRQSADIPPESK